MDQRIETLETTVTSITEELVSLRHLLVTGLQKVDNNFEKLGKEINHLNGHVTELHQKVDLLRGDTNESLKSVDVTLEKLTEEIVKIGTVTNYEEYFKNMKALRN